MPKEHRAQDQRRKGRRKAERYHTRHDRPHGHARLAPGRPKGLENEDSAGHHGHEAPAIPFDLTWFAAVRLAGEFDRAERVATARLARPVRMAAQ